MSTSVLDNRHAKMARIGFVYLFLTLLCALFGAGYEYFSHGVYSYYMLYAFAFPLMGGVLPFFCMAFFNCRLPGRVSLNLYHSGVAAWTVGSIFEGVLEIYGTTNRLVFIYWMVGAILFGCGILLYMVGAGSRHTFYKSEKYGHDF